MAKKAEKVAFYQELIPLAFRVVKQSEVAIAQVRSHFKQPDLAHSWIDEVIHYRQLLERVIDQAQRRVLNGENVPASEKMRQPV